MRLAKGFAAGISAKCLYGPTLQVPYAVCVKSIKLRFQSSARARPLAITLSAKSPPVHATGIEQLKWDSRLQIGNNRVVGKTGNSDQVRPGPRSSRPGAIDAWRHAGFSLISPHLPPTHSLPSPPH